MHRPVAGTVAEARHVAWVGGGYRVDDPALDRPHRGLLRLSGRRAVSNVVAPSDRPLNWWLWWDSASRVLAEAVAAAPRSQLAISARMTTRSRTVRVSTSTSDPSATFALPNSLPWSGRSAHLSAPRWSRTVDATQLGWRAHASHWLA